MATDRLDAQVENLMRRGVALPRHPLRASEAAQEMHNIAAQPGELRRTLDAAFRGETGRYDIDQNTKLIRQMRTARMQKTGSDTYAAIPRFYDPMEYWDLSGLPWNMADEGHRHKLHKWLRLYYATHYLVPILIDIFTRFPLVGMEMYSKDQKLADFYEEVFMNKLDYPNFLVSLGREFWTVGEAFPLGSFDEDLGVWEREELLNPEDIIIKNFPMLGSQQMLIKPPDYLKKLAQEKSPAKEYRQLEINFPELIPYLKRNENIPVSGVLLKQVANKLTDWDDHGTPILLRGLRTLMHEEKLTASQDAIAERLYSPFILAKLGIQDLGDGQPPWVPDAEQLGVTRDDIDVALSSDFRLLVHHFGIEIENVFGREQMPRLGDDFDRIERRLMQIFGVNPSLLSAGAQTQPYASSALQAEFLNQILRTYQGYLKQHFEARARVVAEAQEHFDYEMRGQTKIPLFEEVVVYDEEGKKSIEQRPKLLIPELKFQTLDLRDEATERQFIQTLRAMGVPVSDKRLMVGVNFDIEDEIDDYNEELVKKTVAQQEAKMKAYTILREKNLPIPPDLKAEVESVLNPGGSPSQLPPGGMGGALGQPAPGGPGAPMAPAGPTGGPGESVVMPPPPSGLTAPGQNGSNGPPPGSPSTAGGPGGGATAPPISMERRKGMPRPAHLSSTPDPAIIGDHVPSGRQSTSAPGHARHGDDDGGPGTRGAAGSHRLHHVAVEQASAGDGEAEVEPWFPTLDHAVVANQTALAQHGQGNHALLRPEVLEGALGRAAQHWHYEGSLPKAAAALAHGVGQAQAFEDGNKRTAYWLTHMFLHKNGLGHLAPDDDVELADHLIGYGAGTHRMENTAATLEARQTPNSSRASAQTSNGLGHVASQVPEAAVDKVVEKLPRAATEKKYTFIDE